MKYLGLLAALVIVYLVAAQMTSTTKSSFAEAEAQAAAVDPSARPAPATVYPATATPPPAPSTAGSGLRRPLDRARELNGVVELRNGGKEF